MYKVRCRYNLPPSFMVELLLLLLLLLLLHPFSGLCSRTTWVSRHQKGKPFWLLLQQEMMRWQCHQLDHMQIMCTRSRQITTPVPHHSVFTGRMPFLPPNQQRQSTEGTFMVEHTRTHTTILRLFSRDHPGEPVPEENFWTL